MNRTVKNKMRSAVVIAAIVGLQASAHAMVASPMLMSRAKFAQAMRTKLGMATPTEELKLVISEVPSACGSSGAALVAELQIKRSTMTEGGSSVSYESIKSYSATLEQIKLLSPDELAKSIMADDQCGE